MQPLTTTQKAALEFCKTKPRVVLSMPMGTGKTRCAIELIKKWSAEPRRIRRANRTLVICPAQMVRQKSWEQEIEKWCPEGFPNGAEVRIVSCDSLTSEKTKAMLKDWRPDALVIDELTKFKNHTAARTKVVFHLTYEVKYAVGMTGTLTANGLQDLWAQYSCVTSLSNNPLGANITSYRREYFYPYKFVQQICVEWKPCNKEQILSIVKPITYQPSVDPVYPKQYVYVDTPLEPESLKAYKKMMKEYVIPSITTEEDEVAVDGAAVLRGKLRQLSEGFVYVGEGDTRKVRRFSKEKLEKAIEIASEAPTLIFCAYKETARQLLTAIEGARTLTSTQDIDAWNDGRVPALIVHPRSAGFGLNLQYGGNRVLWVSPPDSMEEWLQGNARVARMGQRADRTIIYTLIAPGTVDEHVKDGILQEKLNLLEFAQDYFRATIEEVEEEDDDF